MIVVTGGSKGIGRAIVSSALSEGLDVLAVARGVEDLEALSLETQKMKGTLHTIVADLSTKAGCRQVSEYAKKHNRGTLALVNNVGQYSTAPLMEQPDIFESLLTVNLLAAHRLTSFLWTELTTIVNIGSVAAIDFPEQMPAYTASKSAFHAWHKALEGECVQRDIRLGLVVPGATLTSSWDGETNIPDNILRPEQIADAAINMLLDRKAPLLLEIRPN